MEKSKEEYNVNTLKSTKADMQANKMQMKSKEEIKADELIEIYPLDYEKRIKSTQRMINLYERRCNLEGIKFWQKVKQILIDKQK